MTFCLVHRSYARVWLTAFLSLGIYVYNASAQEPAPVIVLGSGHGVCVQTGTKAYHGLLVRELMRQSLLLAAREELQIHIQDVSIGEATAADANWELACSPGNPNLLELLRGRSPTQASVWQHPMQLPGDSLKYDVLLDGMEKYSRSIFPKVLKEQLPAEVFIKRFAGESGPFEIDSALLDEVFVVPQFAAVRKAQVVVSENRFDPLRLESVIRGNANLGLLTECYWHPAHIGYKARALLYAQRWVARDPESARAVYCRAYAWHMAGNNALALADLEQAKKLADSKKEASPTWAAIIQEACQYRITKLSTYPANQPHFKLARLLAAVAASLTNEPERAKTIAFLQRRETQSPRLFEGWYELDQQDERDDVWEMASGHFGAALYDKLAAVPLLPAEAQAIGKQNTEQPPQGGTAEELASRAALIATLSDPKHDYPLAEPSNRALAVLIQQATFLHAWGGGLEDATIKPLADCLKGHPYFTLLRPSRTAKLIKDVIAQLDYDQLQYKERRLFAAFSQLDRDAYALCFSAAERHRDLTTADYLPRLPWRHPKAAVKIPWQASDLAMARAVLEVDPLHPYARTVLIEGDYKSVQPHFSDWAESAADHRKLANALSIEFERDGNLVDAEKLLVDAVKVHDDFESHQNLAAFYGYNKQVDKWLATWTEWLDKNPEAKERPGLLAALAEAMISERNLVAAEKYVLEAVQKKDNLQALLAAGAVYEVKEDWATAEQYYRRASESETVPEHEWFMFCRRVGQGDEAAAKKLAESYFAEFVDRNRARRNVIGVSSSRADLFDFHKGGTFGAALGRPVEAMALFQEQFNRTPDPSLGLHAALMAVELRQPETRDKFIQRVIDEFPKYQSRDGDVSPFIVLAKSMQADVKAGLKTHISMEKAHEHLQKQKVRKDRRTDFDYLLGRWYEACGEEALAKEAYLHCLAQPTIRHNSRTLAGIGLRRLGGSPADYRERFQPAKEKEAERE